MSHGPSGLTAAAEKKSLKLTQQPVTLRRCLDCEYWMRSTGPDHRRCNTCKGIYPRWAGAGSRVTGC